MFNLMLPKCDIYKYNVRVSRSRSHVSTVICIAAVYEFIFYSCEK